MTADSGEGDSLVAVLKRAVSDSGLSLNEIARRSGVAQSQLSRFMRGERLLALDSAEKVMEVLGVKVSAPTSRPMGKRK